MTKSRRSEDGSGPLWADITEAVRQPANRPVQPVARVFGGDINRAMKARCGQDHLFVKLNRSDRLCMFEAEAAGLNEIAASGAIRCPRAIATGCSGDTAFLVLEFLELKGSGDAHALGRALAALHRVIAPRFGWTMDNTLGSTPQPNDPSIDWVTFLRDQRLGYQLSLAADNGVSRRLLDSGEELLTLLPLFFSDYAPVASLLHGDLWGGNYGYLDNGEPVVFDPAVYFGDRESDLAMTELFGGFEPAFHAAYRDHWPLDPGYRVRRELYQLYHVLNHFNLFGGGYAARAGRMIDNLLSEVS